MAEFPYLGHVAVTLTDIDRIRVNDQWRIVFRRESGDAHDLEIDDCTQCNASELAELLRTESAPNYSI